MKEEEKEFYLRLELRKEGQRLWQLVWCGPHSNTWKGIEECERGMLTTGFFNRDNNNTISIEVCRISNRPIYVFFQWDEEEGCTEPLSVIRCDSWWKAERYFKKRFPKEYICRAQIKHVSECKWEWERKGQIVSVWDEVHNMYLDEDLITNPETIEEVDALSNSD